MATKKKRKKNNTPSLTNLSDEEDVVGTKESRKRGKKQKATPETKRKNNKRKTIKKSTVGKTVTHLQKHPKDANKRIGDWSEARAHAFGLRKTNPNAYYYRHLAPGESKSAGAWSDLEKELFFKRKEEVGVDGEWGIFSMAIPGRVGYQCCNFYRRLIASGEVVDPAYFIDENNKVKKISANGRKRQPYVRGSSLTIVQDQRTQREVLLSRKCKTIKKTGSIGRAGLPCFMAFKIANRGGFRVNLGDLVEYFHDDCPTEKGDSSEKTMFAVVEEIFNVRTGDGSRVRVVAKKVVRFKDIQNGMFGEEAQNVPTMKPISNAEGCGEELVETRHVESFWGNCVIRPLSIAYVRLRMAKQNVSAKHHPIRFILNEDLGILFWRVDAKGRPFNRSMLQKNVSTYKRKRKLNEWRQRHEQKKAFEEKNRREDAELAKKQHQEPKYVGVSEYEEARIRKMQENRAIMEKMGLL